MWNEEEIVWVVVNRLEKIWERRVVAKELVEVDRKQGVTTTTNDGKDQKTTTTATTTTKTAEAERKT